MPSVMPLLAFVYPLDCFPPGEGMISSIGVDGSGYKQYKTGPGLLTSLTYVENMLLWVTVDKGENNTVFIIPQLDI